MPHCPKVCVYFDNKLMRGNRTVKVSAGSLHAFDSPNLPPLARAHVDIDVDQGTVLRPASMARFRVVDTVCQEVPFISKLTLLSILREKLTKLQHKT